VPQQSAHVPLSRRGERGVDSGRVCLPWGSVLFGLAWAFVAVVAVYDVSFAWYYRANFHDWELNPLAREVARLHGLGALFGLKAAGLGFAVIVAGYCYRCRHWLTVPYTVLASSVHLALSLHYLVGHFQGG